MIKHLSAVVIVAVISCAAVGCERPRNDQRPIEQTRAELAEEVGPLDMTGVETTTPTSVRPLSGELIALVDSYDPRIVLVSAMTGKTIARYDRKGRGPGEMLSVGPLQLLTDSTLLIPDPQQSRAIVWEFGTGAVVTIPLPQSGTARNVVPSLVGYAGEQRWVRRLQALVESSGAPARSVSDASELVITDSSGTRPFLSLSRRALVVAATSTGDVRAGLGGLAPAVFALCDSGVIDVDTSGVRRYSFSGTLVASHRHQFGWIPMTRTVSRDYIKGVVGRVSDTGTRSRMAKLLEAEASRIDRWFGGFFITPDGAVWIRLLSPTETAIAQIDQRGQRKRTVVVPSGVAVTHVGVGYLIGVQTRDDLEEPTYRLFRFTDAAADERASWRCGREYSY
jgi:hypothetical protein